VTVYRGAGRNIGKQILLLKSAIKFYREFRFVFKLCVRIFKKIRYLFQNLLRVAHVWADRGAIA
jgi:hypothetical protein